MTEKRGEEGLSHEELDEQSGEELPEREAMALVDLTGESTVAPVSGVEPPGIELHDDA